MTGEQNLNQILKKLKPLLNEGEYVFCSIHHDIQIDSSAILGSFKEKEGLSVIISRSIADQLKLNYDFVAAWITLTVHSSLQAIGLTAVISKALADHSISCNVVAAYYHDHIFVSQNNAEKAMKVLHQLLQNAKTDS